MREPFDPAFEDSLVRNGKMMGQSRPLPWKLQIEGGNISRISELR